MRAFCLTAALCLLAVPGRSYPQPQTPSSTLTGVVRNAEDLAPVKGASVYVPELRRSAVTGRDGTFTLENLPSGSFRVSFSFTGFAPQTRLAVLERGKTSRLEITLELSLIEMEAVTITGTPRAQAPLEATQAVDVLAGRTLQREWTGSLGQTLKSIAGVDVVATGSNMGKPVIRGLSGQRVRVLYSGVAMEYQQFGVRHAPYLDPMNAGRIEVVRGPASVLYGSDALGGVINVIPPLVPVAPAGTAELRGAATGQYFANNGEVTGQLKLEGARGGLGYYGILTRRSAGNLNSPSVPTFGQTGVRGDPRFSGELDHTDFDQLTGALGLGYLFPTATLAVHYDFWRNEGNFLLPSGGALGNNLENDELRVEARFAAGPINFRPVFNYQRNLRQANPPGKGRSELPGAIVREMGREVYTLRLEGLHTAGEVFSGTFGTEFAFHDQNTSGAEPLTPSAQIRNYAVYLFEEALLKRWSFSAGLRFDHRRVEARANPNLKLPDYGAGESAGDLKNSYNSMAASFGGSWRPVEELAAAFNLGRGFRAPDVFELHAFGEHGGVLAFQLGDPRLEPESSLNADLSLRWRSPRLEASATVYRNSIDNYIFLLNDPALAIAENVKDLPVYRTRQTDALLTGFDLSVKWSILSWLAWENTFAAVNGENERTGAELPLMPPDRYGSTLIFSRRSLGGIKNLRVEFNLRHTRSKRSAGLYEPFSQFDISIPFGVASTGSYTLLNLDVGFDIDAGRDRLTVNLGVLNLADEDYRDFLDTYKGYAMSPGRNVYLKLKVPFNLL
ncbi:MAG: TonB-dependent receptor [Candidatus Glassbacteria bacterium]|nr:TonB-dependent receptor [Candidatus Glassbacteria bacterium]